MLTQSQLKARIGTWCPLALGVMLLVLLMGCADSSRVSRFRGVTLHEDTVYVRGVAPILQGADTACGPACLAGVAAYWDRPVSTDKLQQSLGPSATQGAHSADELAAAARGLGLKAYPYQGALDNLDANLRQGRPVIVLVRRRVLGEMGELGMDGALAERIAANLLPKHNHWVVVVGADRDAVIVQDPALGLLRLDRAMFDSWWADRARMALLVVPGSRESAAVTR